MYQTGGYSIDVTKILAIKDPYFSPLGFTHDPRIVIVEVVMTRGVIIKLQYKLEDYRNKQFDCENFSLTKVVKYEILELQKKIKESKGYGKDS